MVPAYFFLLGLLPFVNVYRFNPEPSFWVQWVVFLVATLFTANVLWLNRAGQKGFGKISLLSVCLLSLSGVLFGQVAVEMAAYKGKGLFAIIILLIPTYFHYPPKYFF